MTEIAVVPGAFRAHGNVNATQAGMVTAAGTVDQVAAIQAASAVFGPIAMDFLSAFAVAQANHAQAVTQLAQLHAATDVASHAAASGYESTDAGSAAGFAGIAAPQAAPSFDADSAVSDPADSDGPAGPGAARRAQLPGITQGVAPSTSSSQLPAAAARYRDELISSGRAAGLSSDPSVSRAVPATAVTEQVVAQPVARTAVPIRSQPVREEAL